MSVRTWMKCVSWPLVLRRSPSAAIMLLSMSESMALALCTTMLTVAVVSFVFRDRLSRTRLTFIPEDSTLDGLGVIKVELENLDVQVRQCLDLFIRPHCRVEFHWAESVVLAREKFCQDGSANVACCSSDEDVGGHFEKRLCRLRFERY